LGIIAPVVLASYLILLIGENLFIRRNGYDWSTVIRRQIDGFNLRIRNDYLNLRSFGIKNGEEKNKKISHRMSFCLVKILNFKVATQNSALNGSPTILNDRNVSLSANNTRDRNMDSVAITIENSDDNSIGIRSIVFNRIGHIFSGVLDRKEIKLSLIVKARSDGKSAGIVGRFRFNDTSLFPANTFVIRTNLIFQVSLCLKEVRAGID
jgi:hypothetical protein